MEAYFPIEQVITIGLETIVTELKKGKLNKDIELKLITVPNKKQDIAGKSYLSIGTSFEKYEEIARLIVEVEKTEGLQNQEILPDFMKKLEPRIMLDYEYIIDEEKSPLYGQKFWRKVEIKSIKTIENKVNSLYKELQKSR